MSHSSFRRSRSKREFAKERDDESTNVEKPSLPVWLPLPACGIDAVVDRLGKVRLDAPDILVGFWGALLEALPGIEQNRCRRS